jgi:hypothetical protein
MSKNKSKYRGKDIEVLYMSDYERLKTVNMGLTKTIFTHREGTVVMYKREYYLVSGLQPVPLKLLLKKIGGVGKVIKANPELVLKIPEMEDEYASSLDLPLGFLINKIPNYMRLVSPSGEVTEILVVHPSTSEEEIVPLKVRFITCNETAKNLVTLLPAWSWKREVDIKRRREVDPKRRKSKRTRLMASGNFKSKGVQKFFREAFRNPDINYVFIHHRNSDPPRLYSAEVGKYDLGRGGRESEDYEVKFEDHKNVFIFQMRTIYECDSRLVDILLGLGALTERFHGGELCVPMMKN